MTRTLAQPITSRTDESSPAITVSPHPAQPQKPSGRPNLSGSSKAF
eukprot:CAMPEP_0174937632 /NCGR_PEP_ID=MMETSP1355-20121228/61025_1 /TAXON_ID=464990 /ORGANISM="Hemiselmis tepida, Strain CCMP443" /LENGTH=45 /DNA_ID= /DNA_START= /DNA_END= /DNA_ORIENTATION=